MNSLKVANSTKSSVPAKVAVQPKTEVKKVTQPLVKQATQPLVKQATKTSITQKPAVTSSVKSTTQVNIITPTVSKAPIRPKVKPVVKPVVVPSQQPQSLSQIPQLQTSVPIQQSSVPVLRPNFNVVSTTSKMVPNKIMLEEQEIKPNLQEMVKNMNKPSYDLEKGLSFEIKTLQKHFQFNSEHDQSIPVMVSVKTMDSTTEVVEESKENVKQIDSRPSVDLICVIDNSGSMQGEKIQNVKTTLLQLLDMLNTNDRLSLILFNSYPILLCNLRKVDDENKGAIQAIINSITADGGTDINSGMVMAFNILQKRQFFNPVSSIFLLSDGQDGRADEKIKSYLNSGKSSLKNDCFTIHSFGFGSDHDGPLMNRICELKDGNFYYVEKIDQVDEFFIDALGGLFSVVAQDIQIEINLNRLDENFKKYFQNCKVSKTYGDMWKCLKQDESYQVRINQLFSGVSKDFIFELSIPKQEVKSLEDFERNLELVKGQLTAIPVDIQYTTKIIKENNLILTLFLEKETVPVDSEINDNVEFNYIRVKAAEAMEVAITFAEQKQYDQGQQVLSEMLVKIGKSHPKNKEKLNIITKDILDCQESAKPRVYEHEGKYKMLSKKAANYKQASQAVEGEDLYQNAVQKKMVMVQKSKKM